MKKRDYVDRELALEKQSDEFIEKTFHEKDDGEIPAEKESNGVPETRTGVVEGAINVRLRKSPNKEDDNIETLIPKGTKVQILSETSDFYKVRPLSFGINKKVGYIAKECVKIIN